MTLPISAFISEGQRTLEMEANALIRASARIGQDFAQAATTILKAAGKVVVTGLGKSGHVARKVSATFASTGTPSFYLHPSEALHGDLGMIQQADVLIAIAFGGETEEVISVAKHCKRFGVPVISITGRPDSTLGKMSDYILDGSVDREVCPHNLAPTTSTAVALGLGDAMAMALMCVKGFSQSDFARLHPSGALGRRLATVEELMKAGEQLPTISPAASFHDVLEAVTRKNYGIVPVLDSTDRLVGAISDGDIRRALLLKGASAMTLTAEAFMTKSPRTTSGQILAVEAFKKMEDLQITSLFVVEENNPFQLRGIVRMHDLLAAKIV